MYKDFELKIRGKNKDVVFNQVELNQYKQLEFKNSTLPFQVENIVFDEEKKALCLVLGKKKVFIKLSQKDIKNLLSLRNWLLKDIGTFYRDIIKGKENLILFPVDLDDCPYIATSEVILDRGHYSPKYNEALLYVFSNECIKNLGINKKLNIKDFKNLHKELSEAALKLELKPIEYKEEKAIITTYSEILGGMA